MCMCTNTLSLFTYMVTAVFCLQDEIKASQIADGESLAIISVSFRDVQSPSVFKKFR